jgi:predicted site-specific integrase-resolvase
LGNSREEEKVEEGTGEAIPIAVCIRVSSEGQATKRGNSTASDFERQRERMDTFISERFAGQQTRVVRYERVASSVNFSHEVLLKMLGDILDGKFRGGYCCVATPDRLGRISLRLLEWLIEERGGCKVLYAEENEEEGSDNELCAEILSCLHYFCNKKVGMRTRERHKVFMSPELLRRTWKLTCSRISVREIVKRYGEEGLTDDKGRSYTKHVVQTLIRENRVQLEALYGLEPEDNNFTHFVERHIRKSEQQTDILSKKEIMGAYKEFCRKHPEFGEYDTSNRASLTRFGFKTKLHTKTRTLYYVGIKLNK